MLKILKSKTKLPMSPIMRIPTEMKIRTIAENDPELFDCEVNELLENGWTLVDRRVVISNESKLIVFYAALEKRIVTNSDVYLKGKKVGEI